MRFKIFLSFVFILFFLAIGGGIYFWYAQTHYPVDLVYLWVDGSDKNWLKKKTYWQSQFGDLPDNATNVARFRQFDELKYSLRSVEQNLPWIHHIYIVTDNQVPEWLNLNHPKITIVDHTQIMPADSLPTFNSVALETRIPYIPGLAEHFLYANDDCYVRVPLEKSFFFNESGLPRVFVKFKKRTYDKNLWLAQIQKAHILIAQKYPLTFAITPSHNIQPYRKSFYLDAIREYRTEFNQTTYSKFRKKSDLNRVIVELRDKMLHQNQLFSKWDKGAIPATCGTAFSLIANNFKTLDIEKPCLFCLNDFEGKTDQAIQATLSILEHLFPQKSSFEK